jgi:hypothetical protein
VGSLTWLPTIHKGTTLFSKPPTVSTAAVASQAHACQYMSGSDCLGAGLGLIGHVVTTQCAYLRGRGVLPRGTSRSPGRKVVLCTLDEMGLTHPRLVLSVCRCPAAYRPPAAYPHSEDDLGCLQ